MLKKIARVAFVLFVLAVPAYATDFYVDADVSSGTHDGSAGNPWQTINWTSVNTALASANVTIYFSCREASSDTSDTHNEITLNRSQGATGGPFRLTLDGMTKWNTNDSSPSWMDYGGLPTRDTPKAKPVNQGSQWAIGWGQNPIIPAMDYITLRGFETTGSFGRFRLEGGGSHFIIEYNYVHDVTDGGPGMQFNAGGYAYSTGPTIINPTGVCTLRISHLSDDVIFRYNKIVRTVDENLYFGGNGEDHSGNGFDCPGHSNIQFIGNTLADPAVGFAGEGDCFDLKNGVRNITYSGNIVGPCWRNGIPLQGAAVSYQPQTVLVEGNIVHDTNTSGGTGAITLIVTWTTVPSTVTIRNNIVYNGVITANDGSSNTDGDGAKYNVNIYNNTLDGSVAYLKYINGVSSVQNNIVLAGGFNPVILYEQVTGAFTDDYNATYTGGGASRGAHSIALTSGQVAALFVDEPGRDYRLASTSSAAYNAGVNSTCPAADYYGNSRPQFVLCDIGADEFTSVVVCTPHHLSFISQPSDAVLGGSLGPVNVGVYSAANVLCNGATNSVTLTKNGSATWGTLASDSSLSKAAVSGIATWTDLSVTGSAGSGAIDAAATGLTGTSSNSFTITSPSSSTYESAQGWCQKGNVKVSTHGSSSTTTVQGSYPTCNVQVYLSKTTTLATIYLDGTSSHLDNPFQATNVGHWQFYAESGLYDVVLSGGTPTPGISPPLTLTGVVVAGTTPTVVASLPTCTADRQGQSRAVTNSSTTTWGAAVVGGGSNHVLAYCNGVGWTVIAK